MNVNFDTERFENDPKGLIEVLSNLYRVGAWSLGHHREIEEIVCRTPSSALKFCHLVNHAYGVSGDAEKVFVKNPSIGIRYLRLVGRSEFLEEKVQKRFWRKVLKSPDLALEWATAFGRRLPEGDEIVLAGRIQSAKHYAMKIVGGRLPDPVHERIVLRSFENLDRWEKRALEDYLNFAERTSKKPEAAGA